MAACPPLIWPDFPPIPIHSEELTETEKGTSSDGDNLTSSSRSSATIFGSGAGGRHSQAHFLPFSSSVLALLLYSETGGRTGQNKEARKGTSPLSEKEVFSFTWSIWGPSEAADEHRVLMR